MLKRSNTKPSIRTVGMLSTLASLSVALLMLMPSPAAAGGFQLSVDTASETRDPQMKDVVLIARTYGCHQPADAKLSATAEGLVNGNRQSVPVELRPIGSGVYAVRQQWPSEGKWVLALTGAYNGMTCSVLVELGPNGRVLPGTHLEEGNLAGVHAKAARRKWIAADIDAALNTPAGLTSGTSDDLDRLLLSPLSAITWVLGGLGAAAIGFACIKKTRREPGGGGA